MIWRDLISIMLLAGLAGCGPSYSPDTYASNAAQQANKVDPGIVVGVRKVGISAAGTVGTVTGAAAGGIAGAQLAAGPVNAFTALGGSLVGGIAGSTVEHATADTEAYEYIVRKPNNELISVTQKDKTPLALGQNVLVITGNQARVVPDYTVSLPPPQSKTTEATRSVTSGPEAKAETAKTLDLPLIEANTPGNQQSDRPMSDQKAELTKSAAASDGTEAKRDLPAGSDSAHPPSVGPAASP